MIPDLPTQLGRIADATDPAGDPIDLREVLTRPTGGRSSRGGPVVLRIAAGIAAVGMVAALVATVTGEGDEGERARSYVTPSASETANADLLDPGQAQALPPAPIEGRYGAATVWTGTEVFVWGGGDERTGRGFSDGATFDVRRNEWQILPPSPLGPRADATAVWTGTEVVVWGGFAGYGLPDDEDPERADGAAFDPVTRTWRTIADAPISGDGFARAVWTGQEVVVLTGRDPATGAVYDPIEDEWRRIAEPPMPLAGAHPQALWTGERVVAALGSPHEADVIGLYAYDPAADRWEEYDQPVGAARADRVVWAGDRVLQVAVDRAPEVRDPATGRWAAAGTVPPAVVATTRQAPTTVWTGRRAVVWGPGFVATFDPGPGTWSVTGRDRQPTDAAMGASVAWADGVLFAWGGFPDVDEGALVRPADPGAPAAGPERWSECRTDAPSPAPARGKEPALSPGSNRFGATMADGRPYEVEVLDDGYAISIGGAPAGSSSGAGITAGTGWSETSLHGTAAGLGLAVGIRPPGSTRTSVVDHTGVARCEGIAYSSDGRWFAVPDVDRDWLVVHQDAAGVEVVDPAMDSGPCTVDNDCPGP